MKKLKFYLKAQMAFFIGLLFASQGAVQAQTLVLPSLADNFWYPLSGLSWGLNTAAIAYNGGTLFCSVATSNAPGSTPPTGNIFIFCNDLSSGLQTSTAIPLATPNGTNDIIIGNSNGTGGRSTSTDYIIAISFVNMSGDPEVDFYDVNTAPLITITSIATYVISAGTYHPATVHLDVIADYTAAGHALTGYPFCGNFMITWDDNLPLGGSNVYVAEGDLNTQTVGTPHLIGSGFKPDVAGIKKYAFADDVALVAYNTSSNSISMTEWDPLSSFSPTVILDPGTSSTLIDRPRIDAFDDYNMNSNPSISQYKVVARATNSGTSNFEVRTYDNLFLGYVISNMNDLSSGPYPAPSPDYAGMAPSVSIWGKNGYAVQQVDNYQATGWAGGQVLVDQPVDCTNPMNLLWGNKYYWVNSGSPSVVSYNAAGADFFNSVSCTPNLLTRNSPEIFAWAENPSPGAWNVKYKVTFPPPSFKPASSSNVTGVNTTTIEVFPNPATEYIRIKNALSDKASNYVITDMAGHIVSQGNINADLQNISLSTIVPGNYSLKVFDCDNEKASLPFVKN